MQSLRGDLALAVTCGVSVYSTGVIARARRTKKRQMPSGGSHAHHRKLSALDRRGQRGWIVMTEYLVDMNQKPEVTGFFDEGSNTISYVVKDPSSKACAVI